MFNDNPQKYHFPTMLYCLFVCEILGGNPLDKAFIDVHTKKFTLVDQNIDRLHIFALKIAMTCNLVQYFTRFAIFGNGVFNIKWKKSKYVQLLSLNVKVDISVPFDN